MELISCVILKHTLEGGEKMAKSSLDAMAVSFLLCCNPYLTLMLQQRAGLLLLLLACEEQAGGVGWNCTSQVTSRLHKLLFFCVFLAVFFSLFLSFLGSCVNLRFKKFTCIYI